MYSVLYVDDENDLPDIARSFLEQGGGFKIDTCLLATDALEKIRHTRYDAIVSDYQMPVMDGIEFLREVRSGFGDIPFILFTGRGREEVVITAIDNGADFYVRKGGDPHAMFAELAHKIRQAVTRKSAEAAAREHYSELLKSQQVFHANRELYRTIFETTGTAIIIVDEDTTISLANTQFERLSGYAREEIEGKKSWTEFAIPEDLDRMLSQHRMRRTDPGKALQSYEFRFRNKAGEVRNIHLNINMIPGSTRSVASLMDITERKKAEEALRESEERLQLALDGGELGAWHWNVMTGAVIFNERWAEMLGYQLSEIEPHLRSWERLVHPDDMPHVQETLTAHLGGRTEYYECEHRLLHKSGSWIWVLDKGKVTMRDKAGKAVLASGTHLDVSRRKLAEEALRESEEKSRTIIENMQDIYYRSDAAGGLVSISPAGAKILGYDSPDEIIGKNIAETLYYIPRDREQFLRELGETGSVRNRVTTLKKRDGSPFIISANCHFYTDKTGRILGVEGILHDIDELKKTRDALAQANRKLGLLTSITRHDSLNKLTILQSYLNFLDGKLLEPELSSYLSKAKQAGNGIRQQIEFTKVYEGLGLHDPRWENLGRILGTLSVPPGINLTFPVDGVEILADPLLLKVFENLLDNSVRHGEKVTTVSVTCRETGDGLTVIYEDNGTGIAVEEKEMIFERGYGKNTGLGLFLVREVLAITGMNISERGVPGSGARFEIAVPQGSYRFGGNVHAG